MNEEIMKIIINNDIVRIERIDGMYITKVNGKRIATNLSYIDAVVETTEFLKIFVKFPHDIEMAIDVFLSCE